MTEPERDVCNGAAPMTLAMLVRELAREDRIFHIEVADRHHGSSGCWDRTNGRHDYTDYRKKYGFEWEHTHSDAAFAARFQSLLRRMEADGWVETERSRTRRVFWHTGENAGKFWIICQDGNQYEIQYGRIPKHLHHWRSDSGRMVKKAFPTQKRAASAYRKLVAEKTSKGYLEVHSRVWLDPALRTPNILTLARAAKVEPELPNGHLDPVHLAVLADALEEAGCTDRVLLGHLRDPGPHVRACWAVDLVLAKK